MSLPAYLATRACGRAAEWVTFYAEYELTAGNNRYCSCKVMTPHISHHTQTQLPRAEQAYELSHQQGRSWERRGAVLWADPGGTAWGGGRKINIVIGKKVTFCFQKYEIIEVKLK